MTIVYAAAQDNVDRLHFALGEDATIVGQARDLDAALEANPHEDLVVIGPGVPLATATGVAERYRASRPALGVVLIRPRLDVSTLAEALRAGIREVVPIDDGPALLAACSRSRQVSVAIGQTVDGRDGGHATTILVFSAKGGCGKTTVATNLAVALAEESGGSVCVVDLDLQFGDVAVALQVEPDRTMSDLLRMGGPIDASAARSLVVPYRDGVDLVLAPTNPADVERITAAMATSLIEALRGMYDYLIIDSAPAFTEVILAAFEAADQELLLTTLDMPALKNLKVTLDTLLALGLPKEKRRVVVNRSDAKTGLTVVDVEALIGVPVSHEIPGSSAVPAAANAGVTLVEREPRHPVTRTFREIAKTVIAAEPTAPQPTEKRGLFRGRQR